VWGTEQGGAEPELVAQEGQEERQEGPPPASWDLMLDAELFRLATDLFLEGVRFGIGRAEG
jgi:hypothetical protein